MLVPPGSITWGAVLTEGGSSLSHACFPSSDCGSPVVMVFRTWALWGRGSKVVIYLSLTLIVLVIPYIYFANDALSSLECRSHFRKEDPNWRSLLVGPNPRPGLDTCWLVRGIGFSSIYNYSLFVFFESSMSCILRYTASPHHYYHPVILGLTIVKVRTKCQFWLP